MTYFASKGDTRIFPSRCVWGSGRGKLTRLVAFLFIMPGLHCRYEDWQTASKNEAEGDDTELLTSSSPYKCNYQASSIYASSCFSDMISLEFLNRLTIAAI